MDHKLSDHTLEALERNKSEDLVIIDYNREDYNYGVTFISYTRTPSPSSHLKYGLVSLGFTLPATLLVDGIKRLGFDKEKFYFHTETGDFLGASKNVASERANDIGLQLMRESKYDMAKSFFNVAYFVCESGYRNEDIFKRRRDEAEECLTKEAAERERREREEREREEKERLERHRREQERLERERRDRERREQQKLEENAKVKYREAQKLWNDAFNAEIENKAEEARDMFQKSLRLFREAHSLNSTMKTYERWVEICTLKIEGNVHFNEGVALHEEANTLRRRGKYEEALEKFKKAKNKYQEALDKSKDARFNACIHIVDDCINEINEEMLTTEIQEQTRNVQISDTAAKRESKTCNVQRMFKENNPKISFHKVLES